MRINPVGCNTPALNSNVNVKAISKNNSYNPSFGILIEDSNYLVEHFLRKGHSRRVVEQLVKTIEKYQPKNYKPNASSCHRVKFLCFKDDTNTLRYGFAKPFYNPKCECWLEANTPSGAFKEIAQDYNEWLSSQDAYWKRFGEPIYDYDIGVTESALTALYAALAGAGRHL